MQFHLQSVIINAFRSLILYKKRMILDKDTLTVLCIPLFMLITILEILDCLWDSRHFVPYDLLHFTNNHIYIYIHYIREKLVK